MENASKALIIAGAILLSILIISLGIMVFQNAKGTVGSATLNSEEIDAFNSKWTSYIGSNITSTQVNTLINSVQSNNQAEQSAGTNRYIYVLVKPDENKKIAEAKYGPVDETSDLETKSPVQLPRTCTYTVTVEQANNSSGYQNGLIRWITVTANS